MQNTNSVSQRIQRIIEGTDRCVLCGMCLTQCPTYSIHRLEGDAPRGRITLMQGLAQGHLAADNPRLQAHLQGCLGCHSCETICPAQVPFAAVMDETRAVLWERQVGGVWLALSTFVRDLALRQRGLRRLAAWGLRGLRRLRVADWFPLPQSLQRGLRHTEASFYAFVPPLSSMVSQATAASVVRAAVPRRVSLFSGCMDAFFTGPDSQAAVQVLEQMGVQVDWPTAQVCCGAIDQHLGRPEAAQALAARNQAVFGQVSLSADHPVIVLDSGCEAQWREHYPDALRGRVMSLTAFLATLPQQPGLWRAEPVRIALHLPCTLRNVTGEAASLVALLTQWPGVTVVAVVPPQNCCGAAGTAMLTQPEMADTLGLATWQALQAAQPDVVVSPNVGCSVHLRALAVAAAQSGHREIPVLSPAQFLAGRRFQGSNG